MCAQHLLALLRERDEHLTPVVLGARAVHEPLLGQLVHRGGERCQRHAQTGGHHVHGVALVQADGHDGVHLGDGEAVRQAVVERLLLDAQNGVERARQQIVDLLAPLARCVEPRVRTGHVPTSSSFLGCPHHTALS